MKTACIKKRIFLCFLCLVTALVLLSCTMELEDDETEDNGVTVVPGVPMEYADNNSKIADHTVVPALMNGEIPESAVEDAVRLLHIGYGHTSHGSQLTSGMSDLVAFANDGNLGGTDYEENLFLFSHDGSQGLYLFEGSSYSDGYLDHDCGYSGWDDKTRTFLDDVSGINVIIWSWCGQVGDFDEEGLLDHYLNAMDDLEEEYPNVAFVYMTGHLDGSGENGSVYRSNQQIRQFCIDNDKWLFDFADIESHGPDGVYYGDRLADDGCNYDADEDGNLETDGGDPGHPADNDANWALDWQAAYTEGEDWYQCGSSHSYPINANMKAYAAWWLWCRLAGWDGDT